MYIYIHIKLFPSKPVTECPVHLQLGMVIKLLCDCNLGMSLNDPCNWNPSSFGHSTSTFTQLMCLEHLEQWMEDTLHQLVDGLSRYNPTISSVSYVSWDPSSTQCHVNHRQSRMHHIDPCLELLVVRDPGFGLEPWFKNPMNLYCIKLDEALLDVFSLGCSNTWRITYKIIHYSMYDIPV